MRSDTNPMSGLQPVPITAELAEDLGVPIKTSYEWRRTGRGPVCILMGRQLTFAVSDVRDWIENQRETAPGRSAEKR